MFKDAFGWNTERTLALEDLTREDIKLYVRDKLEENKRFVQMKAKDERCQELIQEIVDKAKGVFLWVFLVVRSLLSGFTNADKISVLHKRLRLLPPTLEEYFRHMLDSVEEIYQEQTAQTFQIALQSGEPLSLITFSFLDEEDPDFAVNLKKEPLDYNEVQSRQEDMHRRLDGRCKGLLEVTKDSSADLSPFFSQKVDFLHRTVRDFLATKDMQTMLADRIRDDFNARIFLCKAFLAQMKVCPPSGAIHGRLPLNDLLEDMLYYARQIEIQDGIPQIALLDEAENSLKVRGYKYEGQPDLMELIIRKQLLLYAEHKFKAQPELIQTRGKVFLDFARNPTESKYYPTTVNEDMVELLFTLGVPRDREPSPDRWTSPERCTSTSPKRRSSIEGSISSKRSLTPTPTRGRSPTPVRGRSPAPQPRTMWGQFVNALPRLGLPAFVSR